MNVDEFCNVTTKKLISNVFGYLDSLGRFLEVRKSSKPTV